MKLEYLRYFIQCVFVHIWTIDMFIKIDFVWEDWILNRSRRDTGFFNRVDIEEWYFRYS